MHPGWTEHSQRCHMSVRGALHVVPGAGGGGVATRPALPVVYQVDARVVKGVPQLSQCSICVMVRGGGEMEEGFKQEPAVQQSWGWQRAHHANDAAGPIPSLDGVVPPDLPSKKSALAGAGSSSNWSKR